MAYKSTVKALTNRSFDAALLNAGFQAINPAGLEEACYLIRVINASNVDVEISYDGVAVHDYVMTRTSLEIYAQPNITATSGTAVFKKGTIVYVKQTAAPGVGEIDLSAYYQPVGV